MQNLPLIQLIKRFLSDVRLFSKVVVQRELRPYQLEAARAIVDSVIHRKGLTFAVVMSRQAGKNELSAQLEAYLMNLYQQVRGATLVKASPTYKPQTVNSRMRLRDCLDNEWNRKMVHADEGYIVRLGRCRAFFFSAHPSANVVGATASVLLECDEAQDVDAEKWDKEFAPMGASTNVTTVFYGTMWTSRTLLSRVIRQLRAQEQMDGIRRVFFVPWQEVAKWLPAYGEYVRKEILRLGADHPIIKTQYELQEIDEAGRLFTAERMARMQGTHERLRQPRAGERYALLVDVAGSDEWEKSPGGTSVLPDAEARAAEPRRDSTVVTVVRVDLSTAEDALVGFPTYEVVNRYWWTGRTQAEQYAALADLIQVWEPLSVVVDATAIGAGLASFLVKRYGSYKDDPPGLIVPFEFTRASKSDLGWDFLAVIETGRYKEYADDGEADTAQFWREVAECEYEVLPGPGKGMRWGVADATVHDDMVLSAALVAVLDKLEWGVEVESEVIAPKGDTAVNEWGNE
ncbi:MAG: hypothetical protein H5T68_11865 [Chloroflexi bacterium]|nr:hypothetical protein [Chloroflexota bacterium]